MLTKEDAAKKLAEEDYEGAYAAYKKLKTEYPHDLDIIIGLVSTYLERSNPYGALSLMELEEETFKENALFYKHVATLYTSVKNKDKALIAIGKAIELESENPDFRSVLGYICWSFGDTDRAVEETEKALKLALGRKDASLLIKIKNNLAYYYTILEINEQKAREYAEFSYQHRQEGRDIGWLIDTYAYVKMKFTRELNELDEAISLFIEAAKADQAFREPIASHIKEAIDKRTKLLKESN